ncbi:MAG: amidohydrolase [Dehalococcoidia bacterium]|nr:amidohydrolase [Dehalococcoidia bacterium]
MLIDFHTHIFPPTISINRESYLSKDKTFGTLYSKPRTKLATAEDLIGAMDVEGVAKSVILNIGWNSEQFIKETNDYLLERAHKYKDRLIPFCCVNPVLASAPEEIRRCANAGAKGIGELHPDTQGFDLGDKHVMAPVMRVADEFGLPIVVHSSEPVGHQYDGKGKSTPELLMKFISNFPDSKIVCAHWGGGLPFYALMPEVAAALKNVYFDTSVSPFLYTPNIFTAVPGMVRSDQILFGSDFPLMKASKVKLQMESVGMRKDIMESILGGNAEKLLGLV